MNDMITHDEKNCKFVIAAKSIEEGLDALFDLLESLDLPYACVPTHLTFCNEGFELHYTKQTRESIVRNFRTIDFEGAHEETTMYGVQEYVCLMYIQLPKAVRDKLDYIPSSYIVPSNII